MGRTPARCSPRGPTAPSRTTPAARRLPNRARVFRGQSVHTMPYDAWRVPPCLGAWCSKHRSRHARHDDASVLRRLTESLDHVATELRELVEEEDAAVRECSGMSPEDLFLDQHHESAGSSSMPDTPRTRERSGPPGIGRTPPRLPRTGAS